MKPTSPYLFTAADYWAYLQKNKQAPTTPAPHTILLTMQGDHLPRWQKRLYHQQLSGFSATITLLRQTAWQVGLASHFGVGGPATAALLETLVVWGVKRFVLIGVAGGLQPDLQTGDIILPTHAIGDDGVSHHYHPSPVPQTSNTPWLAGLQNELTHTNTAVYRGTVWSTSAPFREKMTDIETHTAAHALAVDMETAALFAVGQALEVETGAVLVVGDLHSRHGWHPPTTPAVISQTLIQLQQQVIAFATQ